MSSEGDLRSWVMANARAKIHPDDRSTKFAIALWYLWKWRCTHCFDSVERLPRDKSRFLMNKVEEVSRSLGLEEDGITKQPSLQAELLMAWVAHPPGWVVVNTDGASRGNPG